MTKIYLHVTITSEEKQALDLKRTGVRRSWKMTEKVSDINTVFISQILKREKGTEASPWSLEFLPQARLATLENEPRKRGADPGVSDTCRYYAAWDRP